MTLKRNRAAGAWWIWAGILGGLALDPLFRACAGFVPSQPLEELAEALKALSFGFAAVWLLAGYLEWKHRLVSFLAVLGISLAFGIGAGLVTRSWSMPDAFVRVLIVALGSVMCSVALSLTGLICRKSYSPIRLLAWAVPIVAVSTALILAPFFFFAFLSNPGRVPVKELAQSVAVMAGMNLGVLLIYLLLSIATAFYRRRLQGLLHLGERELPPVIAPIPAPEFVTAK